MKTTKIIIASAAVALMLGACEKNSPDTATPDTGAAVPDTTEATEEVPTEETTEEPAAEETTEEPAAEEAPAEEAE